MTERRAEIESVFEAALEQAPEDRPSWLDTTCGDDLVLRREVEALLHAHERHAGILDRPVLSTPPGGIERVWEEAAGPDRTGERVGPYRLVREIGRGGMGIVYLAERDDGQFEQRVAVKVLRDGAGAENRARRFLDERRILASLQHPLIARLYDGGLTEKGQPCFVMEYVEGRPIDRYCAEQRLSIEDRLRLFVKVGEAVRFAHRNLIVHRDLKPSNIFVTDAGRVKLLDFGIARLLDPGDEEDGGTSPSMKADPSTQADRPPLTPDYASPEQVCGEPVTTASDVYQLGLVLFELLTGRRPYSVRDRAPDELRRVICDTAPERPSETVSSTGEAESRQRQTTPKRLRKTLSGDLDAICLKALRKAPERRYGSADALIVDIERFLQRKPIAARPQTVGYRASAFIRRHRWGAIAASLLVVLLLGYAVTVTRQARQIARERDKAEQVTRFLVDVFEVPDPSRTRGDTVTARELLDDGAARVRRELSGQPDVQAAMLHALGRSYRRLGLFDRAASLLEAALDLRRARFDAPPRDIAASLHELGALRLEQGAYDRAAALLDEALSIRRSTLGPSHPAVASTLSLLGRTAQGRQQFDHAGRLYRSALAIRTAHFDPGHPLVADTRFDLATTLHDRGAYAEARVLFEQAVSAYRALDDVPSPRLATGLYNLASYRAYGPQRDYAAAESLYREAVDVRRILYGPEHPQVAAGLIALGHTLEMHGRTDSAGTNYRRATAMLRRTDTAVPSVVADALRNYGDYLADSDSFEAAVPLLSEAVAMDRTRLGSAHPDVGLDLNLLADALRDQGRFAAADTCYREVLAIYRNAYGPDHTLVAEVLVDRASLRRDRDDLRGAEADLRDALGIYQRTLRTNHRRLPQTHHDLGVCLYERGHYEEAENYLLRSLSLYEKVEAPEVESWRNDVVRDLVRLYEAWGRPDRAAAYRARLATNGTRLSLSTPATPPGRV